MPKCKQYKVKPVAKNELSATLKLKLGIDNQHNQITHFCLKFLPK